MTPAPPAPPAPRRLVVMRHAKAEQHGPTDFQRPLAERGHDDARAAGRWLASLPGQPDHALVSAALRTRETWAAVCEGAGWGSVAVDEDRALYEAGVDSALDLLRERPSDAAYVVVVGHNPTMGSLAQLLDDGEGDDEAGNALAMGYPTSALSVFDVECPWEDLYPGRATLVAHHVARG